MSSRCPRRVLNKTIDGKLWQAIERMIADVPGKFRRSVIDKISSANDLVSMTPIGSRMRLGSSSRTRGLFGYRNGYSRPRGRGIMASTLDGYAPVKARSPRV